ncbi:MAG: amidase family protein [Nitriliruptorales bacterium]
MSCSHALPTTAPTSARGCSRDSPAGYVAALRTREELRARMSRTLGDVDCVVGPTVGVLAPRIEEAVSPAVAARLVANTRLANVVGVPAISLPLRGDGLPVGLQVTAAADAAVLGIARQLTASLSA